MISVGVFLVVASVIVLGAGIGGSLVGVLTTGALAAYGAVVIFRAWRMWGARRTLEGASNWATGGFVVGGLLLCLGLGGIAYTIVEETFSPEPTTARVALSGFSRSSDTTLIDVEVENTGDAELVSVTLHFRFRSCEVQGVWCEEIMKRRVGVRIPSLAPGKVSTGSISLDNVPDINDSAHEGRWSWHVTGINGFEIPFRAWTRVDPN